MSLGSRFLYAWWRTKQRLSPPVQWLLYDVPKRAENPFSTHLPVLAGLARILPIRRVLEYGCGTYSTITFLDRRVFPDLEKIDSYENDAEWGGRVKAAAGDDARLTLHLVSGVVSAEAAKVDPDEYDLVLVDDSSTFDARVNTLLTVSRKRPAKAIVAIHDYETRCYRRAAKGFRNRFWFNALHPSVGVAWNDAAVNVPELHRLNQLIRANMRIPSDNLAGWLELLDTQFAGARAPA